MLKLKETKIIKLLHLFEDVTLVIATIIVLVLTLINVFLRYVLSTGILWSEEFIGFNLLYIGIIGTAACVRDELHTSLDNLVCNFPLKIQKFFFVFGNLLVISMLGYFIYGGVLFLKTVGTQVSFILRWPMKIFYSMIPIGCFLCLIEQIINFVDSILNNECRFITVEEKYILEQCEGEN